MTIRKLFINKLLIIAAIPVCMGIMFVNIYASGANLSQKAEKKIKAMVGKTINLEFKEFKIPGNLKGKLEEHVQQEFYRESVGLWKIKKDGEIAAYAIMDDVPGKQMPITFLVLFDKHGTINTCYVLKYRERFGSGVRSKRWLRQFNAKNASSGFKLGKDIDGISGATISSLSMSKGIEKLTRLIKHILPANRSAQARGRQDHN